MMRIYKFTFTGKHKKGYIILIAKSLQEARQIASVKLKRTEYASIRLLFMIPVENNLVIDYYDGDY